MAQRLVAITGCIASGKSTVARGMARRLRAAGVRGAAVDLDLLYETLADDPKSDDGVWSSARRIAGAIGAAALAEGVAVVIVDGELWTEEARRELLARVPASVPVAWFTLSVSFEEALRRARGDPTRGRSKDPAFLREHLDAFQRALPGLRAVGEVIETEGVEVEEVVGRICERVRETLSTRGR